MVFGNDTDDAYCKTKPATYILISSNLTSNYVVENWITHFTYTAVIYHNFK